MIARSLGRWELVGFLWLAYFLNQADRQILSVVAPLVRDEFDLSAAQFGLIVTVFTLVFGLLVPVAGMAGDRFRRARVVVLSLAIFSAGTLLTGLASSYLMLLVFRGVATGGGEAFYTPAATAWIAEHHDRSRGTAFAIHHAANYSGVILGSLIAGWIADHYGWRPTFLVFGLVGIVWAGMIAWRTRGDNAGPVPQAAERRAGLGAAAALIVRSPRLLAQIVGFSALIFVLSGYSTWMPTILHDEFGLSLAAAGFASVAWHHVLAYAGLSAGAVTDRLRHRYPRVRLWTMGGALLVIAPFIWLAATAGSEALLYFALAGFGLARGIYDSNMFAAIYDEVEDRLRASVAGLIIACSFIVGASSPWVMGMLAARQGLRGGMTLLAAVALGAGLVFLGIIALTRRETTASEAQPA